VSVSLATPVNKHVLPDEEAGFNLQAAYQNVNHFPDGNGDEEEILVPMIGEPVLPELTFVNAFGAPIEWAPKHLRQAK